MISAWLDPHLVGEVLIAWSGRVLGALAIFVIGRWVVRAVTRAFNHSMDRVGLDSTLNRFFGKLIYMGLLVFVVLMTTTKGFAPGFGGLAVGLTLTLIHLISIPVDNTSVNPARSFGAAIFGGSEPLKQLWAFVVFPLIGAIVGTLVWIGVDDSTLEDTEFGRLVD